MVYTIPKHRNKKKEFAAYKLCEATSNNII